MVGAPEPHRGGTLTLALTADPATLNRFEAADVASLRAIAPTLPNLYQARPDLSVEPDLATAMPTISADGLRYTVHLRPAARWSDGKPITADDVIATVGIETNPGLDTDVAFDWRGLDHVARVDDHTVTFVLSQPLAPFLANSLVTFVAPAHIYSPIDVHRMRTDPTNQVVPVSGGPFMFLKRVPGQEIQLVANPTYYRGRPYLDKLIEKVIPDAGAELTALQDGVVQWLPDVPALALVRAHPAGAVTYMYPDLGYYDLRFNDRPDHLFGDPLVRRALAMTIDKAALVRQVTEGTGTPLWGDIVPASWAFGAGATVRYSVQLDAARALMTRAGWTVGADGVAARNGTRFEAPLLVRSDSPTRQQAAAVVAKAARAIGINLTPKPVDFATFYDPLKAGTFEVALAGFATGLDPDEYAVLHSSQLRPDKSKDGLNWTGYQNPQLDTLIEEERSLARSQYSDTLHARRRVFDQVQTLLGTDVVTYHLWADGLAMAFSADIGGVVAGNGGSLLHLDAGRNSAAYAALYLRSRT